LRLCVAVARASIAVRLGGQVDGQPCDMKHPRANHEPTGCGAKGFYGAHGRRMAGTWLRVKADLVACWPKGAAVAARSEVGRG
jgi:hypothetical protein